MAPATYRTRVATRPESEPSSQSAIFGAEPLPQDAPTPARGVHHHRKVVLWLRAL